MPGVLPVVRVKAGMQTQAAGGGPAAKRQHTAAEQQQGGGRECEGGGLAGPLDGYGSGSDSE